jgi:hypothetical protein
VAAAPAVERLADAAVATVTSADAASALAAVVTPNVEYAAAGGTDTSAANASGGANLAVGASIGVGMLSAEKAAAPAERVDDTGSETSPSRAKENLILTRWLAAATAAASAAFTAACAMKGMWGLAAATAAALAAFAVAAFAVANVMDGMDGGMAAPTPCLSFLLGVFSREGCDNGSGCCPALRQLRRGEVMDLMIQMKSLNCFMIDTNDTLNESTVAVDVWCDDYGGWCVTRAWLRGEVMWREEVMFRSLTEGMELQEKVSFRTSGQTTSKWLKPQMTISNE